MKITEKSFYLVPVRWHYINTLYIITHRCMCIYMWQLTKQSFHWLTDGRMTLSWLILKEIQYHILQNKDLRNLHLFLINSVWQNECICCLSHYTTNLNLKFFAFLEIGKREERQKDQAPLKCNFLILCHALIYNWMKNLSFIPSTEIDFSTNIYLTNTLCWMMF